MAFKVEGIDYTPKGIKELRETLIGWRADIMKQWPETIHHTVVMTHVIALLAYLIELIEENE